MISDKEKTKKANRHNNFTESNYQVDKEDMDLDFNLLFDTLDSIFEEKIMEEKNLYSDITKQKTSTYDLLRFVQQMYQNTWWNQINQTTEVRPELCTACLSLTCSHVNIKGSRLDIESVIDEALEKCSHQKLGDWIFDDMCSKCIILSCEKVTLAETTEISVLWDETDLLLYLNWINKIDKENILYN